jgi:hypothetical protein
MEPASIQNSNSERNENATSKITSCQTTLIELDDDDIGQINGAEDDDDHDIYHMSFLLSIFDNIVGPKLIHYWSTQPKTNPNKYASKQAIDDQLLKYIAIHTLNGELYQDKLISQQKYRLYLIQEIGFAIFSIFFDASTISSSSYGNSSGESMDDYVEISNTNGGDSSTSNRETIMVESTINSLAKKNVATALNCFCLIVPLEKKDILAKNYGENTSFLINTFENMILEYKVYAQIKPKVS